MTEFIDVTYLHDAYTAFRLDNRIVCCFLEKKNRLFFCSKSKKNRLKISIISLQEIAYFVTHCRAWMRLQRLRNYLSFCCKCKFFWNHFTLHVISNAHRRRIVIVYTFLWWNLKSKKKTQEDFGLHFALISKWAPKIVWNFVKKNYRNRNCLCQPNGFRCFVSSRWRFFQSNETFQSLT